MRRSQSMWWIAGTLCVVGLIATAPAQEAQQAQKESETKRSQTDKAQPENTPSETPRHEKAQTDKSQSPEKTTQRQLESPVMLGVRIAESATTGVYVQDVMPQSAADRSGIQPRDYILSINGKTIASPQEFDEALRQFQADDKAEFTLWRNRQKQNVNVSFADGQRVALRPDYSQFEDQRAQQPNAEGKRNHEAWLGVRLGDVRPEDAPQAGGQTPKGVLITGVYPSGPAARAGIYRGDIVTQVDGKEVTSPQQFAQLIGSHKPNETVKLTMKGDDGETTTNATLGDREDFAAALLDAPQSEGRAYTGDYTDSDVSEHALLLEQHRHFAEQHERIEERLEEVLAEVRSLRKELNESTKQ